MNRHQIRILEKLERESAQASQYEAELRAFARQSKVPEEAFLRATKGHEKELEGQFLGHGELQWYVFDLLYRIAQEVKGVPVEEDDEMES
jgi:hypothetical protein